MPDITDRLRAFSGAQQDLDMDELRSRVDAHRRRRMVVSAAGVLLVGAVAVVAVALQPDRDQDVVASASYPTSTPPEVPETAAAVPSEPVGDTEPTLGDELDGWRLDPVSAHRPASPRDRGRHVYLTGAEGVAVLTIRTDSVISSEQVDDHVGDIPLTIAADPATERVSVTAPLQDGTVRWMSAGVDRDAAVEAVKGVLASVDGGTVESLGNGNLQLPDGFIQVAESGEGQPPLARDVWNLTDGETVHELGRVLTPSAADAERLLIETRMAGGHRISDDPEVWFTPGPAGDGTGTITWAADGARWSLTAVTTDGDWQRFVEGIGP